ncbi:MAG TPA: hypothetical protein PL110_20300 [Candidatus Eremiobacteraeota bacterium]|nr:MAG: hypothetical protein BWY64_03615 [bacterium ADurb.Bin363]HPZ10443.1 hypothetical protein [Candidatus Eremiobacteraeota bacterium]
MKDTEIIEALRSKLSLEAGRHLYGVLGSYKRLNEFTHKLKDAVSPDGTPFPVPLSVNKGILSSIPDEEFRELAENEAKRPEPTASHVEKAFEAFLRANLKGKRLIILAGVEMLFTISGESPRIDSWDSVWGR